MTGGCGRLIYETGGCWHGSTPSVPYNELSGFLSIVLPPLLTLAGIALLWCWHNQCHRRRCWRVGRHLVDGTHWCRRHHPDSAHLHRLRNSTPPPPGGSP